MRRCLSLLAFVWLAAVVSATTTRTGNVLTITWPSSNGVAAYVAIRFVEDYPNGSTQATPIYGSATTGGTAQYTIPVGKSVMVSYFCNPTWNSFSAEGPFAYQAATFKVTVSLRNNRDVPVRYRLMQGSTVLGEVTLQPGQALIQQFTTTSTEVVTVFEEVDDLSFDGTNWVIVEGAVTTKNVTPGSGITPVPSSTPTPTPTPITPSPDIPKTVNPNPKPDYAPVWKNPTPNNNPTGQVDLLTNSVFREGVDKIGAALNSIDATLSEKDQTPTVAEFPQQFTETLAATGATEVNALVAKLPTAPQVLPSNIGSSSHFQFTLKFPPLTQTFAVDVDMAPYSAAISFIRGLMKACLSILFFFLVVNTLKKAVA